MIDGPGPPFTTRATGSPSSRTPAIRCARMRRFESLDVLSRETHRILFVRVGDGGACSGYPKTSAAIAPERPTTCGIRGRGSENPPRAQTGSTPNDTRDWHGPELAGLPVLVAEPNTPETAIPAVSTKTTTDRLTCHEYGAMRPANLSRDISEHSRM